MLAREQSDPMTAAAWPASLAASLKKNKKFAFAKYFQIATVRDGRPACRTVVFRGFHEDTAITFVTDAR